MAKFLVIDKYSMLPFKLWLENQIIEIPLSDLIISRDSLFKAMNDISRGRVSKTQDLIHVWENENKYQLVDGYHRVFEYILSNQKSVQAEVIGRGYSDYWATVHPEQQFQYNPNTPYHGLEDLADEEILEELKQKLFRLP